MRAESRHVPVHPLREMNCEVVFNRALAGPYWHLSVSMPSPAPTVNPGQFFQLLCPGQGSGNHVLRRPMSAYRIDDGDGRIEFLYKVVGVGTHALTGLAEGDSLNAFGPLGYGFRLKPDWRHVILLGRGAGLATLAPLAKSAITQGIAVTAVLSTARPELAIADVDGSAAVEQVESLLRRLAAMHGSNLIATCGSERLLHLVQRLADELGIAGQVALEQPMACGIGMCFCCVRPFSVDRKTVMRRICSEGPVFDVREAVGHVQP
jgi:dihydroorotate dehydrogenase electron transfer subunit